MPIRTSKNTKKQLKEITKELGAVREEQAVETEKTAVVGDTLQTISQKVSRIIGVLARNASTVKELAGITDDNRDALDALQTDVEALYGLSDDAMDKLAFLEEGMTGLASPIDLAPGKTPDDVLAQLASIFEKTNKSLAKVSEPDKMADYKSEQASSAPVSATPATKNQKTSDAKDGSLFGMFKSLFTNPVVIAALAGVVYAILPKELQDKIKTALGAFGEGFMETVGKDESSGLKGLGTALKLAAGVLATIFAAKLISSIVSAITTTMKIINTMRGMSGKKLLALGAGVAVGAAVVKGMEGGEEAPESGGDGVAPGPMPEGGSQQSSTAPLPGTSMKSSAHGAPQGGVGIKMPQAGGGLGLKAPPISISGDDASVMDMIKRHEGVRTRPYKDSLGLWTVGVGHLIGDGRYLPKEYDREFSMAEIDAMFAQDYKHHKDAATKIPGFNKLSPSGQAALIDLTFNMGPGWYKKWPNFTKSLETGDLEGAAKSLESSIWYGQVGKRAPEIVSLIRNSGTTGGETTAAAPGSRGTSEGIRTASAEKSSSAGSGASINKTSQDVKAAATPVRPQTSYNVSNSQGKMDDQGSNPMPSIPSPIANRGSLGRETRHSTAYV